MTDRDRASNGRLTAASILLSMIPDPAPDQLEALRRLLFGIAYRMLGIVAGRRRFAVRPEARERVAHRFAEALRAEDRDGVLSLLVDDAILIADSGGYMPALSEVQPGAERIAHLLVGFERAARTQLERRGMPRLEYGVGWLNGEPAILSLFGGRLLFVTVLHLDGDRIAGLSRVMNPAKLTALGRPTVLAPGQSLDDVL